jgi:hypothetical protein
MSQRKSVLKSSLFIQKDLEMDNFIANEEYYSLTEYTFEKGYKEGAIDFANWLRKNAQPRFPNSNEWTLIIDVNNILTIEELYKIFENGN